MFAFRALFPTGISCKGTIVSRSDDISIWTYAKNNGFHILTKDNNFDEWSMLKGCPPKIIHLICGNQTTLFILNLIVTNTQLIQTFIRQSDGNCILKLHL